MGLGSSLRQGELGPDLGEGGGRQSPEARAGCLGTWLLFLALCALRSFLRANVCCAPFALSEGVSPCRPQKVLATHLEW